MSRDDPASDSELLLAVATGQAEAMQRCVARFGDLVWSIARRAVGPDAASDVTQEAFLSIWKDAKRFDPSRGSAKTFVAVLTRRRLIDFQRKRASGPDRVDDGHWASAEMECPSTGPEEATEIRDAAGRVGEAISKLDPPKPELLKMAYFQGMSHARIAEHTGLPLGTIKTHLRRAMDSLRSSLKTLEGSA